MQSFDPDTIWLSLVNIGLGVVCAVFLVIVARAIIRDLAERAESDATRTAGRRQVVGVTMADGGDPLPLDAAVHPTDARRDRRRADPSHLTEQSVIQERASDARLHEVDAAGHGVAARIRAVPAHPALRAAGELPSNRVATRRPLGS